MSALDPLADERRWVAWRSEPRRGKMTKVPYSPAGGRAKTDDPATWGTRAEAEARAAKLINGKDSGGVGLILGDLGVDIFLAGGDLDSCIDEHGRLALWAEKILSELDTYAEHSPSGAGVKAFFYVASKDVRAFLELLGVTDPKQWGVKRSVGENGGDHGPAVEFYLGFRYFTVTDQRWPSKPERIANLDRPALERLAKVIPSVRRSQPSPIVGGADNSRSAIAFCRGLDLARAGKSFDEMCEHLRTDPETGDWYLEKGLAGGMRELKRIWEKAGGGDKAEITRLGRLSKLEYERERGPAAERLGIRKSVLDELVRRDSEDFVTYRGHGLVLSIPEPWSEPIVGAALLGEMSDAVGRYLVMDRAEADIVALWVIAVHAFDAWVIFPRLLITAPEKQCGKTTLLDVVSRLVPKPLTASNITASAVFRTIEAARPCLILDEADAYMREDEALRSVINAGHRRDGAVIRTVGDDHEPRAFSVWAPLAMAAIGRLPGTIEDRSVVIRLRRRKPEEEIQSLRQDRAGPLDQLASKAVRWVNDAAPRAFADADPAMPSHLVNRAADNWRPLLAVADLAGGGWPQRARDAATEAGTSGIDEESHRVVLLGDIRAAFFANNTDRVFSDGLTNYLASLEDRPWAEWKAGRPISKVQMSRLLAPFKIKPKLIRIGPEVSRGYELESFTDAFDRYLPPI